jgi:hypothetical protein
MLSLHKVNQVTTSRAGGVHQSTYYRFVTAEQISIKFGIWRHTIKFIEDI